MKVTAWVSTPMQGSRVETTFEVDDDDWGEMSSELHDEFVMEELTGQGLYDWGYEVEMKGEC